LPLSVEPIWLPKRQIERCIHSPLWMADRTMVANSVKSVSNSTSLLLLRLVVLVAGAGASGAGTNSSTFSSASDNLAGAVESDLVGAGSGAGAAVTDAA